MGKLLQLSESLRDSENHASREGEPDKAGEIVFFTGVRYSRDDTEIDQTDVEPRSTRTPPLKQAPRD